MTQNPSLMTTPNKHTTTSNQKTTVSSKINLKDKQSENAEKYYKQNAQKQFHTMKKLKQLGQQIDGTYKKLLQSQTYLLSALKPKQIQTTLPNVNTRQQGSSGNQPVSSMQGSQEHFTIQRKQQQKIQQIFKEHLLYSNKIQNHLSQKSNLHQIQKQTKVLAAKLEIDRLIDQISSQHKQFQDRQRIYQNQLQKMNQIVDKLVSSEKQIVEKNAQAKKINEFLQKYQAQNRRLKDNVIDLASDNKVMIEKIQGFENQLVLCQTQIKNLKQQNIEIKLENKNLKADNRIVTNYLDKVFDQNIKNEKQTQRKKFLEKQSKIINQLYKKSLQKQNPPKRCYEHEVSSDLTNKILLDQYKQQSSQKQKTHLRQAQTLKERIRLLSIENVNKQTEIDNLTQKLKNMQLIHNMKDEIFNKREYVIRQYEQSNKGLTQQNNQLKKEVQRCRTDSQIVQVSKKIMLSRTGKIYHTQYRKDKSQKKVNVIVNPNSDKYNSK